MNAQPHVCTLFVCESLFSLCWPPSAIFSCRTCMAASIPYLGASYGMQDERSPEGHVWVDVVLRDGRGHGRRRGRTAGGGGGGGGDGSAAVAVRFARHNNTGGGACAATTKAGALEKGTGFHKDFRTEWHQGTRARCARERRCAAHGLYFFRRDGLSASAGSTSALRFLPADPAAALPALAGELLALPAADAAAPLGDCRTQAWNLPALAAA